MLAQNRYRAFVTALLNSPDMALINETPDENLINVNLRFNNQHGCRFFLRCNLSDGSVLAFTVNGVDLLGPKGNKFVNNLDIDMLASFKP